MKHPIYTCLWFDDQAKEAAEFYCKIFGGKIISCNELVVMFEINETQFMGLNGGPVFKPNEATSLVVNCDTQQEIDYFWESLTKDGGEESSCGWLKDKYGFSWQIVPSDLEALLASSNAMDKLLKMKKIEIEKLKTEESPM